MGSNAIDYEIKSASGSIKVRRVNEVAWQKNIRPQLAETRLVPGAAFHLKKKP
jgi:hypothetical protein